MNTPSHTLESYQSLDQVANNPTLAHQIMQMERGTWGLKTGTSEYARCCADDCSRLLTIEDVYHIEPDDISSWKSIEELEKNMDLPCCPDCDSPTELVLKPKPFLVYTQAYFRQAFGAVLYNHQQEPEGIVMGHASAIPTLIGEIDYRQSYNPDSASEKIASLIGKTPNETKKTIAICLNKILLLPSTRGQGYFRKMVKALLDLSPKTEDVPMVADTSFSSRYYAFLRAIAKGNNIDVATDEHGWVLTALPDTSIVHQAAGTTSQDFKSEYGKYYEEAIADQQEALKQMPPKYYKNIPRMPDSL